MATPTLQHRPDIYEIRVKGHLSRRRICMFADWVVAHHANGESALTGPVPDQAALYGLLLRLRDLGIPLLSVNCVTGEADGP